MVDAVVGEVNAFIGRHQWMDFTVWSYRGEELEVSGSTDESYWSDLRVVFVGVCWACIRFQGWKSDTSRPVLLRVAGAEAYSVNSRFQIEVGHHLFKFVPEDHGEPMWVAARELRADFDRVDLVRGQGGPAEPDAAPAPPR
jgi:hypothetical protein